MYYKKIFIKTEADLPKEEGRITYFVHHKKANNKESGIYLAELAEYWLDNYDWYLQPIEQPEIKMPSEEEIEKFAFKTNHGNTVMGAKWMRDEIIKRNK